MLYIPCYGQNKNGTSDSEIKYTVIEDNPFFQAMSLKLGLGFSISEINGINIPLESGLSLILPKISVEVSGVLNLRFKIFEPEIRSIYTPEFPRDITALFSKVIYNYTRIEDSPAILNTRRLSSSTYVDYYIDVPCTIDYRLSIDLAASVGFSWNSLNYSLIEGRDFNNNTYSVGKNGDFSDFYGGTFTNFRRLRTGVSFSRVHKLDVDIEGYGERTGAVKSTVYSHFLFDFHHHLDDINVLLHNGQLIDGDIISVDYPDEMIYLQLSINNKNDYNPFGYAIGFKRNGISNLGINANFEAGIAPGLYTAFWDKLYIRFSFGVSFSRLFNSDK